MRYAGTPLARLSSRKGEWTHSWRFLEMKAARAWGVVPPSKFYEFSPQDQAIMIQFVLDNEAISAYQAEVDREKQEAELRNLQARRDK